VVGVSWYEALAFVRWLNEVGSMPAGFTLRLPSEPEWEKAARGGLEVVTQKTILVLNATSDRSGQVALRRNALPKRRYPWGDEPDPECANYDETKIGSTSAVGCFPRGGSPYGVEEMSGNVWEWTRSLWGTDYSKPDFGYPYEANDGRENLVAGLDVKRVVRGGAFSYNDIDARCAARSDDLPNHDYRYNSFRVVLSPSTSGL
jgi:formylglycine-generating enzyme required for sulfatase activity